MQADLDAKKTGKQRNILGQFATPTLLARQIVAYGLSLLPPKEGVSFLDPAIGTGSFYSALLQEAGDRVVNDAVGFEVDKHYGNPAKQLWDGYPLSIKISDFTFSEPKEYFDGFLPNFVICNPPYVRHHHISVADKPGLQERTKLACGVHIGGLAGLYCYFLGLTHKWMRENAIAGWLVPSEFMDVNYGDALKKYLCSKVTLLRIHRYDPNDVQFDDALVSSAVVWIKNCPPPENHKVNFSYGGTLETPLISKSVDIHTLNAERKWTRFPLQTARGHLAKVTVSDLFKIRRGIATGDNSFFIVSEERANEIGIPKRYLRPILPSSRYIDGDEVFSDNEGYPLLKKRLFLIDCVEELDELENSSPRLAEYLKSGLGNVSERYLCRAKRSWYRQERADPPAIVCTYMGRGGRKNIRPFRFILNNSSAIATNVFLMLYPKPFLENACRKNPDLLRKIWAALNSLSAEHLLEEGRVYGGGLHKLEPKELAKVNLGSVMSEIPVELLAQKWTQDEFELV
jgi:hypothetical protein